MKGATVADNDFFEEAIKETEKVTGDDVENADGKKSYRYFKKEHVDKAEVRRKVESIPFEKRKKRNNVEAAMFQYGFHTRNNKTRYRTLFKHGLQAIARCAWMNMRHLFWFDNKLSLQIAK